jgi:hypothetical protein
MLSIRILALAAFTTALSPSVMHAASTGSQPDVVGRALRLPETRAEGREAIDAAAAAAVVGAISGQFGERKVQVKLDHVVATPNSLIESDVAGDGRLLIGDGDDDWLPFRFACLYDTASAIASAPRLLIGGDVPGQSLDADSTIARQLSEQVQARLQAEFQEQPVRFSLDSAAALETGKRYTRIEARGIVDFGREGTTPADIHALYDRRAHAWVRVAYELGTTANRQSTASGG